MRSHFMPFAVQDYRTSRVRARSIRTNDLGLRTVYLELLLALWEAGGRLQDDVETLADETGCTADEIERVLPLLGELADQSSRGNGGIRREGGWIFNARVCADLESDGAYREAQAAKGKARAAAAPRVGGRFQRRQGEPDGGGDGAPGAGGDDASHAPDSPAELPADDQPATSREPASHQLPFPSPYPSNNTPLTPRKRGERRLVPDPLDGQVDVLTTLAKELGVLHDARQQRRAWTNALRSGTRLDALRAAIVAEGQAAEERREAAGQGKRIAEWIGTRGGRGAAAAECVAWLRAHHPELAAQASTGHGIEHLLQLAAAKERWRVAVGAPEGTLVELARAVAAALADPARASPPTPAGRRAAHLGAA